MQGVTEETMTVATTADTLELQYLKSNSPTRNVNISVFKTQSNHSFVYNTKKIPRPVKNSLCHYAYIHLSSAKHYFGNTFFFFYNKCSSKSPLSLLHMIDLQLLFLHLFGLRCSQAGFAVKAKLQKISGANAAQNRMAQPFICSAVAAFTSLKIGDGVFVSETTTTTKILNTLSFVLGKARTSNVLLHSHCDRISKDSQSTMLLPDDVVRHTR